MLTKIQVPELKTVGRDTFQRSATFLSPYNGCKKSVFAIFLKNWSDDPQMSLQKWIPGIKIRLCAKLQRKCFWRKKVCEKWMRSHSSKHICPIKSHCYVLLRNSAFATSWVVNKRARCCSGLHIYIFFNIYVIKKQLALNLVLIRLAL